MSEGYPLLNLTRSGRMIAPSKSGYQSAHPTHLIAFNGGLYIKSKGHVWSGDMDVTRDMPQLMDIAKGLGETVFVLREREFIPDRKLADIPWDRAIAIITIDGPEFMGS